MTLLVAYARERLNPAKLLPAVLLVVVATLAGRGWSGISAFAMDALLALALVVAFRIWDDLVDRDRDRVKYPDRVVVRARSTTPLRAAGLILGFGAMLAVHRIQGHPSALWLWAYIAVLGISYQRLPAVALAKAGGLPTVAFAKAGPRSAARDRILLLKYGVLTLALVGMPGAATVRGALAAAAAFVAACVYEWWHDAESPVFSFGGSR